MPTVSRKAKRELVDALRVRYREASRAEKTRILDEFAAVTGFHRKHAIHVLNGHGWTSPRPRRGESKRVYDEAVRQALVVLWEASDRMCGKRLKAILPTLVVALENHGHLELDPLVREKVLAASSSTIDRLLVPARAAAGRSRRKSTKPAVRAAVPVRTFADWDEPVPGFMEVDLVAHCGGSMSGSFAHTLVLTDVSSGWIECVPLLVRDSQLIVSALEALQDRMPFPLRGIDTDNGSEFINELLVAFCREQKVEFTRSRPYRKNDQAWIEQKNGAVVRRLVGHGRLSGIAAVEALSRLYDSSRLFVNFFQPSFKLLDKTRVGGRVRKRYADPQTPCARLVGSTDVDDAARRRLQAVQVTLDPLRLLDEIRAVQQHIADLAGGELAHVPPQRDADLQKFLRSLETLWRDGEARPTHKRKSSGGKPRHWRTRKDPFAEVWQDIVLWLEQEPDQTAKNLLCRLMHEHPGCFTEGQLRTLQRRVKRWRADQARRLLFAGRAAGEGGEYDPPASGR